MELLEVKHGFKFTLEDYDYDTGHIHDSFEYIEKSKEDILTEVKKLFDEEISKLEKEYNDSLYSYAWKLINYRINLKEIEYVEYCGEKIVVRDIKRYINSDYRIEYPDMEGNIFHAKYKEILNEFNVKIGQIKRAENKKKEDAKRYNLYLELKKEFEVNNN